MQVKVPDIGDFAEVPVIEIHVKPGDSVEKESPLVTLESDKATMDVPSPEAGTVTEVLVEVNDKVSEGTPIVELETSDTARAAEEEVGTAPDPESREEPSPELRDRSALDRASSKSGPRPLLAWRSLELRHPGACRWLRASWVHGGLPRRGPRSERDARREV